MAISANLLPLTKKVSTMSSTTKYSPSSDFFAERCISQLLTTNLLALEKLIYA